MSVTPQNKLQFTLSGPSLKLRVHVCVILKGLVSDYQCIWAKSGNTTDFLGLQSHV